jgi:hypothetical protein
MELGLNLGYNSMLVPSTIAPNFPINGMCGSMKLLLNSRNKWLQWGLGLDMGGLKQEFDFPLYDPNTKTAYTKRINYRLAKPYTNTSILANYVYSMPKIRLYGGLNLGMMVARMDNFDIRTNNSGYPISIQPTTDLVTRDYTVGIQLGMTYALGRKVDLNAEFAPKTVRFDGIYLIPVTAGLRIKL